MTGTWINIATVLIGGALGSLMGNRLPERLRQTIIAGLGLFTLGLGIQNFLKTQNAMIVLGSLLAGGMATRFGVSNTLAISGVCCIIAAVVFVFKVPFLKNIIRREA